MQHDTEAVSGDLSLEMLSLELRKDSQTVTFHPDTTYYLHTTFDADGTEQKAPDMDSIDVREHLASTPCTVCGRQFGTQFFAECLEFNANQNPVDLGWLGIDMCMRCGHIQTPQELQADNQKHGEQILANFYECAVCKACGCCWQVSDVPASAQGLPPSPQQRKQPPSV
jgi:hypothetical protein